MAEQSQDTYYVPSSGWYPVWVAGSACAMMVGLGLWLNDLRNGEDPSSGIFYVGALGLAVVLVKWFSQVIEENQAGLTSAQLKRSYIWAMAWFIFSEVMFFAAFFGALLYARTLVVPWLGGEGEKGLTGDYLWPEFEPVWPMVSNPNPDLFANPASSMAAPSLSSWGAYLPFWNTVILLTSSFTVHFAHNAAKQEAAKQEAAKEVAVKQGNRRRLISWLGVTVLLGIVFLFLQVEEYVQAYQELGLTLSSGIYGSTFFLLTGFHGFHVTLGTFILAVQLLRAFAGHFSRTDQFGLEAASWYWHFVDVVWVCLFVFVYVL